MIHWTLAIIFASGIFFIFNFLIGRMLIGKKSDVSHELIELEVARGVLCLFVFMGHSVLAYNQIINHNSFWPPLANLKAINYLAAIGIDGFFFITGYLFSIQLISGLSANRFLLKRFFRLMPTLLLVTLMVVFFYSTYTGGSVNFEGLYKWILPGADFEDEFSPLLYGHYWSLRNEWVFYLILFVLAGLRLHSGYRLIILFPTLFALAILDPTFSMILSGVIAGVLQRFGYLNKIGKSHSAMVLFAFFFYLYFAPFEGVPNVIRYSIRWLMIFALGVILVEKKIRLFVGHRVLVFFSYSGAPAYSLYLTHGFVLFLAYVFALNYAYIYELPFKTHLQYILLPAIMIWLLIGWSAYWVSERPYWKFREHFK